MDNFYYYNSIYLDQILFDEDIKDIEDRYREDMENRAINDLIMKLRIRSRFYEKRKRTLDILPTIIE